ncbi:DUF6221 family protein [Streptomyces collinus]|uniref:DUF6221 family protein n=1 Tax=Streptomyces collinus TaxID=42684 RepID=UPI0037B1C9D5
MPDLHGWITQQIDAVESSLRRVDKEHSRNWATQWNASSDTFTIYDASKSAVAADALPAAAWLIAHHDPAAVLRRCEADRRILARHRLDPDAVRYEAAMCDGCGTEGEMAYPVTENLNDCPELLDLAYAHGLTDEILATLDRPQEGERPEAGPGMGIPDVIAQSFASFFAGTRPVEPRPEVKALKILEPELKKLPGYMPTTEERP